MHSPHFPTTRRHGAFTPTAHDSRGLRDETRVSSITRYEPANGVRDERALGGDGVRRRPRESPAIDAILDAILDEGIVVNRLDLDVQAVSDARGGVATDVGSRIDEETREQSVERSSQGARGVRRRTRGGGTRDACMRANADEATRAPSAIFEATGMRSLLLRALISSDATRFLCNETPTVRCELNEKKKEEWMEGRGRTVARRGGLFVLFRALGARRRAEDDVGDGGETAGEIAGRERVDGGVF